MRGEIASRMLFERFLQGLQHQPREFAMNIRA
jgi:hypothetical protein